MRNFFIAVIALCLAGYYYIETYVAPIPPDEATAGKTPLPQDVNQPQPVHEVPPPQPVEQVAGAPAPEEPPAEAAEAPANGPRQIEIAVDGRPETAVIYVPPGSSGPRPLLLLLDPGGNAMGIVSRWRAAAEKYGWYLIATPVTRNGVDSAVGEAAVDAMIGYVRSNYEVNMKCVVLGGFSGGGSVAYRLALTAPDKYRGAIVENGHTGPWRELGHKADAYYAQRFYLFGRTGDFNAEQMRHLRDGMNGKGLTTEYRELPGEHRPMTPDEAVEALGWFDRQL